MKITILFRRNEGDSVASLVAIKCGQIQTPLEINTSSKKLS